MRRYDGFEGEDYRDALVRYSDRASSPYDLAPGLMSQHAILDIQKTIERHSLTAFPLRSYLASFGILLQNSDGTFPYLDGYDGPAKVKV